MNSVKEQIKVDLSRVMDIHNKILEKKSNLDSSFSNVSANLAEFKNSGLNGQYFDDFSNKTSQLSTYLNNLAIAVKSYHDRLFEIEGFVALQEAPMEVGLGKNSGKNTIGSIERNGASSGGLVTPEDIIITTEDPIALQIGSLPFNVNINEINMMLEEYLKQFGLTLAQLYSGEYNQVLNEILNLSPSATIFIETITQLTSEKLQLYLKQLRASHNPPPHYRSVNTFLLFLSSLTTVPLDALYNESYYADLVKNSLIEHRKSLIYLAELSQENPLTIQSQINQIISAENPSNSGVDNVTREMLKVFFEDAAKDNNITLDALLTEEEHAGLAKETLEKFVRLLVLGEESEGNTLYELEQFASNNNLTVEELLNGENNDLLTDFITGSEDEVQVDAEQIINDGETDETISDNQTVEDSGEGQIDEVIIDSETNDELNDIKEDIITSDVVENMEDSALQDYIKDIVYEDKHPTITHNKVINRIVSTVIANKDQILNEQPITEEMNELEIEEVILGESQNEIVKEIFTNEKYASQIKEIAKKSSTFNWLGLLPLAGLGLIPLVAFMNSKKKGNKEENYDGSYYEPIEPKKILIDENLAYFAEKNNVSEESLVDGTNFELLSMYLSQLDGLMAVLNVLSKMKDDDLQKYLKDIYQKRYEHIWGQNSLILKVIFNALVQVANQQGITIEALLSNKEYIVWVKTAIVDLSKSYLKFQENIKINGGFSKYINNILDKAIAIDNKNYNLLKLYIETNSKNLGIDKNAYLSQLLDNDNKLKIYSIITFGDGFENFKFGFLNALVMLQKGKENYVIDGNGSFDDNIIRDSGYSSLLFNSSKDQIFKAIERILENYNLKKEDLFDKKYKNLLLQLIDKSPNVIVTLIILLELDALIIQSILNELYKNTNIKNKFILVILKFLQYLAKSENTTLDALLEDAKYADLIKTNLENFKNSILKLNELSKRDDNILSEEINNLFFMEDPSVFGIDKITIEMLKDFLSDSSKRLGMGLNSLLDIKNISTLRSFVTNLLNNMIFLSVESADVSKTQNTQKTLSAETTINKQEFEDDKENILINIKETISNPNRFNKVLINKIIKYTEILVKDTNMTFEQYIHSTEFSNFIKINFENSNIMALVYSYMGTNLDYKIDIEEQLKTQKGLNELIGSITKENNILYTLETMFNINDEVSTEIIRNLGNIEDKTNMDKIFEYIKEHLKRPTQLSLEEYLSEDSNIKTVQNLLLKVLLIFLFMILLSEKDKKHNDMDDFRNDIIKEEDLTIVENNASVPRDDTKNEEILNSIKDIVDNPSKYNEILANKLKKYIEKLIKDKSMTFEQYINSVDFSDFINTNFRDSNILDLINLHILNDIDYKFDIEEKLNSLAKSNNLNIDELKSKNGVSFIIESIIKEKNKMYTLETMFSLNDDIFFKLISDLVDIEESTNMNKTFKYIKEHVKKPESLSLKEYLNQGENIKNIFNFLLKLLIMILIMLYMLEKSKKEEEVI